MSATLTGVGLFFFLRETTLQEFGVMVATSAVLALIAVFLLFKHSSKLSPLATRAFVGLALVFGAICFGVKYDLFAVSVLWAGVLFGALDSLGKMTPRKIEPTQTSPTQLTE